MKDHERIDYLIKTLEGDNAAEFARKTGIRTDTLSRARNGLARASLLYTKILSAYPQVRRQWLIDDEGCPFLFEQDKSEILKEVIALRKEVRRLAKAVEQLAPRG